MFRDQPTGRSEKGVRFLQHIGIMQIPYLHENLLDAVRTWSTKRGMFAVRNRVDAGLLDCQEVRGESVILEK